MANSGKTVSRPSRYTGLDRQSTRSYSNQDHHPFLLMPVIASVRLYFAEFLQFGVASTASSVVVMEVGGLLDPVKETS
jgi:hypothetical protein